MILFDEFNTPQHYHLTDGELIYYPNFLDESLTFQLFDELKNNTNWEQPEVKVYGKIYPTPRLVAWFGSEEYGYSNWKHKTNSYPDLLLTIQTEIEKVSNSKFNGVLVNYYRNGNDKMGWHADDEKELGTNPVIASLNLGSKRRFDLKHKTDYSKKFSIELENGSLLLMKGKTQHHWLHQIPTQKRVEGERINLTFRKIYSAE